MIRDLVTRSEQAATDRPGEEAWTLPIRPRRRIGYWLVALVTCLCIALLIASLATNKAMQWGVVGTYLFNSQILHGATITCELTVFSMILAELIAVPIALFRLSGNAFLRVVGYLYVWMFRSIPLLVLLIVWFNIGLFYPRIGFGIPYGPVFVSASTKQLVTALDAAVAALGLNEAAYSSEILRTSIRAVAAGQRDAAKALGMRSTVMFRRIILPQAVKIAIPPLGNDTIGMVKSTALVAFIAVPDLLYSSQTIYESNYEVVPLLIVASIWYIVIVTVLTIIQSLLERWMDRSMRSAARPNVAKLAAGSLHSREAFGAWRTVPGLGESETDT